VWVRCETGASADCIAHVQILSLGALHRIVQILSLWIRSRYQLGLDRLDTNLADGKGRSGGGELCSIFSRKASSLERRFSLGIPNQTRPAGAGDGQTV
jgi:hypothetical protein